MSILVLSPTREADLQLFISLAKRLNVPFREEATGPAVSKEAALLALAGSLDTPETGDELAAMIAAARTTKEIDPSWAE